MLDIFHRVAVGDIIIVDFLHFIGEIVETIPRYICVNIEAVKIEHDENHGIKYSHEDKRDGRRSDLFLFR